MATQIFLLPGFHGSGSNHWQTRWEEENQNYLRIVQDDWENPVVRVWAQRVEDYLAQTNDEIVVVAHSLGCLTLAYWAQHTNLKINAALLVAPPDINSPILKQRVKGFDVLNPQPLPFKSILLASSSDPYCSSSYSEQLAKSWGSHYVNLGDKGHLNAESMLGSWEEGKAHLDSLLETKKPASNLISRGGSRLFL